MKDKINLTWDEYFMGIAVFTSFRSKDPNSKVGCVLVNPDNHIVGTGYNGFVAGIDESQFSWERQGDFLNTKYAFVVHAEANAIINTTAASLKDCVLYATLYPCNECAKLIAQKGITKVYYLLDKYKDTDQHRATEMIFTAKNIVAEQLVMDNLHEILDAFKAFYPDTIK